MTAEPLACSLTRGELHEREAELRALLGRGALLAAAREEGGALTLALRRSPGLRGRLERTVALEQSCCPFLELTVEDAPGRLALRIDGPPHAAAVIDGFEALAAGVHRP